MNRMATVLSLSFVILLTLAPSAGQAQVEVNYGANMYLSTVPGHYDPGINEALWDSGTKIIHIVVDDPNPTPGEAYGAIEYGLDYNPELFLISTTAPSSPYPLIFGHYGPGRIDLQMGTGGPVPDQPWAAIQHEFLILAPLENLIFSLSMNTWRPTPRLGENPGYAVFDERDPPLFAASRESSGYGEGHRPDWRAGVVLLNYNPLSLDPEVEEDLASRVQDPGHPLWIAAIPVEDESWGKLKAKY